MNEVLIKAAQLLLSLSILIVIHEFGHYIAARLFKVRVEKFYLFFNPWFSLFKFRKGETEYGMGWLPLGGYVKISGMIDESMDKEQLKAPPQPWEFRTKPAWQRLIIMLGGIIMNIILGIFIFWMIKFAFGDFYVPVSSLKYGITVNEAGKKMGLQDGDLITAVDGIAVENYHDISSAVVMNMAKTITVQRGNETIEMPVSQENIKEILDKGEDFITIRMPFMVGAIAPGTPAKEMDLQPKDIVVSLNGKPMIFQKEVRDELQANKDKEITLQVFRNYHIVTAKGKLGSDGLLGVELVNDPSLFFQTRQVHYSFFEALPKGVNHAWETLVAYVKQFALIFSPKVQGYKHLGGFISIANVFGGQWNWLSFWGWTGFLSIALAFMNLLPIPALDGGHVIFTLAEMVTRRKPSDKFLEYAQVVGMILLLALLVFANGNDLVRLFR